MQEARAFRAGNDAKAGVLCLSDEAIYLVRGAYGGAYNRVAF